MTIPCQAKDLQTSTNMLFSNCQHESNIRRKIRFAIGLPELLKIGLPKVQHCSGSTTGVV